MNAHRPLSVTLAGWLFIVTGVAGLAYHADEYTGGNALSFERFWSAAIRVLAILAGVFLLRGAGWARWLALAWLAYHVILSAFHTPVELALHALFLAALAAMLLRPAATAYFGPARRG